MSGLSGWCVGVTAEVEVVGIRARSTEVGNQRKESGVESCTGKDVEFDA